ncbi:lipoprotein insertase outer membrane protein LolB [Nitrincola tapanii]|uniref:Outer-membrane lipoprotein LolB n=1 Tax=Nitrincola tapanii TaxID=1708751 RepID=A0A5A9W7P5_9GAMM|nr:lipoprotein insertase outer membrane protein LolB [Nitrincola tapanii]KAA0876553.1 outer membrane lipoprotein LolB [Nitrincola tapanii]
MLRFLLLVGFMLLLAGCSSLRTEAPLPENQDQRQARLLKDWQLEGRINIRQADKSESASIQWQQKDTAYLINLTAGPFNQGVARLEGRPGQVEMTVAGEDDRYVARSPEALMQGVLGWSLPVSHANWWIRGVPDPFFPFQEVVMDQGYAFHQAGWQIQIQRYQQTEQGLILPGRLRMQRESLQVTLAIHRWRLP